MKQISKLKDRNPLFLVVLVAFFAAISIFLAHHLIVSYLKYKTFLFESGEFYGDRLLNFSFAKAASEYGINFFDPISRQEIIFYQFFPFWVLGFLARLLNANPWSVANLIQIFLAPAFFITIYLLGKEITGSKKTALLSVLIMFFFGNLEFFITKTTGLTTYGEHAVIMPFIRQIYGFYIDSYALLFGYLALIFFFKIIRSPKFNWKNSIAFIILASISFNTHLLPAIFFIILFGLLLFAKAYQDNEKRHKQSFIFLAATSSIYVVFLFFFNLRPPMFVLMLFALSLFSYFFIIAKNKYRYFVFLSSLVPLAIIMGLNIYLLHSSSQSAGSYNDTVRTKTLCIPIITLIISYLPLITLSLVALFKEQQKNLRRYYAIFLMVMLIVVYNNYFGYNNHPYRFIAYVFPLLSILAAQGIRVLFQNRRPFFSINNILLLIVTVLIAVGSYANIGEYLKYSHTTSRPVESGVMNIVQAIESIRKEERNAVFYVDPAVITVDRLTPYTGAKFYFSSPLNFNSIFSPDKINSINAQLATGDFMVINKFAKQAKLKINYIVSGSKFNISKNDKNKYLIYDKNGLYVYKISKS